MFSPQEKFHELIYYTFAHPDPAFIHQEVVDAFAAQTATENSKPIAVAFALAGLYLYLEKNFTGRQVQLMHMKMGKIRRQWPRFNLPADRGAITVEDVLAASPGDVRDRKIKEWCESVWAAYTHSHAAVREMMKEFLL